MKIVHVRFRITVIALALIFAFALTSAAPSARVRPHVVFVTGDHEYSSEETMPLIAHELEKHYGFQCTVLRAFPDENAEENIPGLEALEKANLAVFFLRWRRLPPAQMKYIQRYLESGRPLVAFRTTTHAFNYPASHELARWNSFAAEYLGAPPGWGNGHYHYGHTSSTDVSVLPVTRDHQILRGVEQHFHVRSWLYQVLPHFPPPDAQVLLMGRAIDPEKEQAIDNPVAWTWKNKVGAKVLMTTLGHPEDFQSESFQRLVINGIHWAAGKQVPEKWAGRITIKVPYHGIREKSSRPAEPGQLPRTHKAQGF